MRTRAFEKWVIVGTAAFAVSSSVALKLAISSEHPMRLGLNEPLLSQIQRGAAVTVKLYPDACDFLEIGQLSCTAVYAGYYNRRKNAWVMTGELDSPKGHIVTGTFKNAPDQPGNISLWGILGTFDNDGNLILHGRVRGSIITAWQNADR